MEVLLRSKIIVFATLALVLCGPAAIASDKKVFIQSTPSGAQVDVNGSITCTTPCVLSVSGAYFGAKHTAFSGHVGVPLSIRILKEGYVPKTVLLTSGPLVWRSLNGQNTFEYYLMSSDHFDFRLDAIEMFAPKSTVPSDVSTGMANAVSDAGPTEVIVQRTLPAIVQVQTSQGSGSGFFITSQGLVATNAHVIGSLQSATIIMSDGKALPSSSIYVDEDRDLALIKVEANGVPFLRVSPTLPFQGSDVIAIGTPGAHDVTGTFLLPNTVTKGIVSGVRQFSDNTVASVPGRAGDWIQTDATINHGNSGGPLLDRSGMVVGINTLSFSGTGTPGLNFALASTELIQVVSLRLGLALGVPAGATGNAAAPALAKLTITSTPPGADIEVDGVFLGNTPSEITVQEGQRRVKITKKGFAPYERVIQAQPNGSQRVAVDLDPEQH